MKKILYLHQYFVTPDEYGATRSYWFCKELVKNGYDVEVVSALSSSSKRDTGSYKIDGIKVNFVGGKYSNTQSNRTKISLFVRYFLDATVFLLRNRKCYNVVYASSTPLTVGLVALLGKKFFNLNYVFEVRDLWPEFPIQIGAIKNGFLIKVLRFVEVKIYSNANHIIALSPGMKEGILKAKISANKVTVIPNMSKPDIFFPREKSARMLKEYSINPENLNLIHFGSMGMANDLMFFLEAFRKLQDLQMHNVKMYFLGYGATKSKLVSMAKEYDLRNVFFLGKFNSEETSEIVNCMDVSVVSFKRLPVLNTNSPNKLFDSLSAGLPILVNSNGWTRELVEQNCIGAYFENGQIDDFISVLDLFQDKEERRKMAYNAVKLSLRTFDKKILVQNFVDVIEQHS